MRRVLNLGLAAFAVLMVPLAGMLLLSATETGSRWIVDRAVAFVPGALSFDEFEGRLLGRLSVQGVDYQLDLHHVTAERMTLDWAASALFRGLVHVRSLEAIGLHYAGPPSEPQQDDSRVPFPDLRPPLPVRADRILVENLDIRQGEYRRQFQRILVQAELAASGLSLTDLQAEMQPLRLQASGRATAQPPYAFEFALNWTAILPDQGQFAGDGRIEGDLHAIRLEHRLRAPFEIETRGNAAFAAGAGPTVQLEGKWQTLRWPLAGDPLYQSESGEFRIDGPVDALQVDLRTHLAGAQIPVMRANLAAIADANRLDIEKLTLDTLDGQLNASGTVTWAPELDWDLSVRAQDINPGAQWPGWPGNLALDGRLHGSIREGAPGITVEIERLAGHVRDKPVAAQARLELHGTPESYRVKLGGQISSAPFPASQLSLAGQGNLSGISVRDLVVDTLEGRLSASGEVAWDPHPRWDLALRAKDIDPGGYWPDLPGTLDLDAEVIGQVIDNEPDLTLQVRRLEGRLRDYPLRGQGRIGLKKDTLTADSLELSSGNNRIQVNGMVNERLELAIDLDARQLEGVWPGLQGAFKGQAQLGGRRDEPRIQAQAQGDRLVLGDYLNAEHIDIELDLDPGAPASSRAAVVGRNVTFGGVVTKSLKLSASGNLERHQVSLAARAEQEGEVDMALGGGVRDRRWHGSLIHARLEHREAGRWDLKEAVELMVGADVVRLAQGCWTQQEAQVCALGNWHAVRGFEAQGDITALPLSLATHFLPEDVTVEGLLDGSFEAEGKDQSLRLNADLKPRPGTLLYQPDQDEPLRLAYHDALLKTAYDGRHASLDWSLGLAAEGRASGRLAVDLLPAHASPVLEGELRAHFPDLAMVTPFVPRLTAVEGSLDAALSLGGTIDRPEIQGRADIERGSAHLPDVGLHITDLVLSAQNRGSDVIAFRGAARSGPGTLDLDGEVQLLATAGWPLTLAIRGQDFQVVRLPEVTALASPDLRFSLRNGNAAVAGKIIVPKARIELKELPQEAVAVSEDEIIEGETLPGDDKTMPALKLSSRVELALGDDVTFNGFGLETGLAGKINVTSQPGSVALGEGQLSLKQGRYRAYGQNLTIDKGKLLFVGPVDNPNLDVRATRKAGDVTAGLEVTGTLKSPRTRVYSVPAKSEAEALAYLLTGRGLAGSSNTDAAMLSQAALSLGLDQSKAITQQIAQTVGLDELTVGSDGDVEESSLLLGKYLTPDLYVRYAYGLFDGQGTVKLRYQLTGNISLEAQSGEAQGVDLLYSIERD